MFKKFLNLNFNLPKSSIIIDINRYKYIIIFVIFLFSINIKSFGVVSKIQTDGYKDNGNGVYIGVGEKEGRQLPELVDGVYQINNKAELYGFADIVNGYTNKFKQGANTTEEQPIDPTPGANAILTQDIEVINKVNNSSEYQYLQDLIKNGSISGAKQTALKKFNWVQIGKDSSCPYTGTFDGNEYTISGIYCEVDVNTGTSDAGLFGCIGDVNDDDQGPVKGPVKGTVKNVGVEHSYFKTNGGEGSITHAGAICGQIFLGTIEKCYSLNTRIETSKTEGHYIGGICGYIGTDSTNMIKNCYSAGLKLNAIYDEQAGTVRLGGIVGVQEGGTIQNCYSSVKQEDMVTDMPTENNDGSSNDIKKLEIVGNSGEIENCYYNSYSENLWCECCTPVENEGEENKGKGNKTKEEVLESLNMFGENAHETCDGTKGCTQCVFLNNPYAEAEGYNEFLVFKLKDPDLKIPVRVKINYDPSNKLETWVESNLKHEFFRQKTGSKDWEEMLQNIHYVYTVSPVESSIKINPDGSKTQDFIFNYYICHTQDNSGNEYKFGFNKKYPVNTYIKQDVGGGKKLYIDYGVFGRE